MPESTASVPSDVSVTSRAGACSKDAAAEHPRARCVPYVSVSPGRWAPASPRSSGCCAANSVMSCPSAS